MAVKKIRKDTARMIRHTFKWFFLILLVYVLFLSVHLFLHQSVDASEYQTVTGVIENPEIIRIGTRNKWVHFQINNEPYFCTSRESYDVIMELAAQKTAVSVIRLNRPRDSISTGFTEIASGHVVHIENASSHVVYLSLDDFNQKSSTTRLVGVIIASVLAVPPLIALGAVGCLLFISETKKGNQKQIESKKNQHP